MIEKLITKSSIRLWSKSINPTLLEINNLINKQLISIKEQNHYVKPWNIGIDSLININNSEKRHMIRGQLVLLGFHAASGHVFNNKDDIDILNQHGILELCAGLEIYHLFTLLHEDLIDRSGKLRKGYPTVSFSLENAGYSRKKATNFTVLLGDMVQLQAMNLIARSVKKNKNDGIEAWKLILEGFQKSSISMFDDSYGWKSEGSIFNTNNNKDEYNEDINLETFFINRTSFNAFKSPLLAGLYFGNTIENLNAKKNEDKNLIPNCRKFSENIGIAYQIIDDTANLVYSPLETGTDTILSITEGKIKAPLFLLKKKLTNKEWNQLLKDLSESHGSHQYTDRRLLLDLIDSHNIIKESLELATNYTNKARENISQIDIKQHSSLVESLNLLCLSIDDLNQDILEII